MIVDQNGVLIHPVFDTILKGTMMLRACELAREHNIPTAIRSFTPAELLAAREVMMVGTTLNVLPVVQCEGQAIGDGQSGPIARQLNQLLQQDIQSGARGVGF